MPMKGVMRRDVRPLYTASRGHCNPVPLGMTHSAAQTMACLSSYEDVTSANLMIQSHQARLIKLTIDDDKSVSSISKYILFRQ